MAISIDMLSIEFASAELKNVKKIKAKIANKIILTFLFIKNPPLLFLLFHKIIKIAMED